MGEEIRQLFKEVVENLEWASRDMGEAIGHFEDASKIAYEIVAKCKALGIEPDALAHPTTEEERICRWAYLFMRLGQELYKTETPCVMYLAYKLYRGFKDTEDGINELLKYVRK